MRHACIISFVMVWVSRHGTDTVRAETVGVAEIVFAGSGVNVTWYFPT